MVDNVKVVVGDDREEGGEWLGGWVAEGKRRKENGRHTIMSSWPELEITWAWNARQ